MAFKTAASHRAQNRCMNAQWAAVVLRIAELINESYVDPQAAARCAEAMRARLEAGAFAGAKTNAEFAAAATNELRARCGDKHLEVVVRPPQPAAQAQAPASDWRVDLRRRNNDFAKVERLPGNVGLLQLDSFPPPEVAGDTAAAAMAFLANADAVIVDLRLNSGGTGDMVNFLVSYFFEERTLLSHTYRRPTNRTTENYTLSYVPGKRMPKTPLYILTSKATFSAAEAFAAPLQAVKRATIIGAVTKGGANPGRYRRVDDTFDVFIPIGNTRIAADDSTWDGKGITPDIPTSEEEALAVAHRTALQRLASEMTDAERKRELEWILASLSAPRPAGIEKWAGRYGNREITFSGGALHQSTDNGPRRRLVPIDGSTFLVAGAEHVKLRFDSRGLEVETSAGRTELFPRAPVP